ncbi:hypothetical protein PHYSODRAFT_418945, partial [Phytophthora sojae]
SLGVMGPLMSLPITPLILSIGAVAPVSFLDGLFLLCLPCAQVKQLGHSLVVSRIPDPGVSAMRSTVS